MLPYSVRRRIFVAGGLLSYSVCRRIFVAGGLSVFVKFGNFYSTSTDSQVKTLNKIIFLTFRFITFSTAFL